MKKTKSILKSVLALFVALSVLAAVSCSEPPTPKKKKKPEVKSVVVTTDGSLTFKKGDTMKFIAAVQAVDGADDTVHWLLNDSQNATIAGSTLSVDLYENNTAVLNVDSDETLKSITVTAISNFDVNRFHQITINLSVISSITVSGPETADQGGSADFTADIDFNDEAPANVNRTVSWSVNRKDGSAKKSGTSINASGLLSIAADEPLGDLVVTARSNHDLNESANAEVEVTDPSGEAKVTKVEVIVEKDTVLRGKTTGFSARISARGGANKTLNWSIEGNAHKAGTTITSSSDETANLLVAVDETPGLKLKIIAVSRDFPDASGFAEVTVAIPQPLPTPLPPSFSDKGIVSWTWPDNDAVTGYTVQLFRNDYHFDTGNTIRNVNKNAPASVDFIQVMRTWDVATYTVSVTVNADGINFTDSDPVFSSESRSIIRREKPSNIKWDSYTAGWDGDNLSYIVNLYKNGNQTTPVKKVNVDSGMNNNSYNFYSEFDQLGNGYYYFNVEAPGDEFLLITADESIMSESIFVLRYLWMTGTNEFTQEKKVTPFDGKFVFSGNVSAGTTFKISMNDLPNASGYWLVPETGSVVDITLGDEINSVARVTGPAAGGVWKITQADYYMIEISPDDLKMRVEVINPPPVLPTPPAPIFSEDGIARWVYPNDNDVEGYLLRLYTGGSATLELLGDPVEKHKGDTSHDFRPVILANGAATYRVSITAIGNGRDFASSAMSPSSPAVTYTTLSNPASDTRRWEGTTIRWGSVTGAASYEIMISKLISTGNYQPIWTAPKKVNTNSFDAAASLANRAEGGTGTYSFSLRSIGSGLNLDNSSFTTSEHPRFHLMLDVSASGGERFGSSQINSIAYGGNGIFVAVGNDRKILRSTDYGLTWTDTGAQPERTMNAVTFGADMFIAVGGGGTIMRSTDGLEWINTVNNFNIYNTPPDLFGVTYGGGRFMAVGSSGKESAGSSTVNRVIHSIDGITWNITANGSTEFALNSVAYGSGRFIAVGPTGRLTMSKENDPETWERISDSILNSSSGSGGVPARAIAYGLCNDDVGRFVIVGDGGLTARASTNLNSHAAWVRPSSSNLPFTTTGVAGSGTGIGMIDIIFADDLKLFFAVGANGRIYTSPTGADWTPIPRGDGGDGTTRFTDGEQIRAAAYGNGRFVFGGNAYATGTQAKIAYSY